MNNKEIKIIEKCKEYSKKIFENDSTGHDFDHTLRVYKLSLKISKEEGGDSFLISLLALLHDVDDYKLFKEEGLKLNNAKKFLCDNGGVNNNVREIILNEISLLSFKGNDSEPCKTIEGKIVQDADRIDALGAIGIARAFMYGGSHQRKMYDPNELPNLNMNTNEYRKHISTTINHFYEKLFLIKDLMNTKTAFDIAQKREAYMKDFVEEFKKEWDI